MSQQRQRIYRTGYMSEIDLFLREFDKNRTQFPLARQAEVAKHKKISAKRDKIIEEENSLIWKDF